MALPVEHGGWGFLLEPVVLGLVLAPGVAGVCLGLAALAAFLIRHPLKLVLMDRRRGTWHPRTGLALRFVLGYGAVALALAGAAWRLAESPFWPALLLGVPPAHVALGYDAAGRSREALPEAAGAVALGASATPSCASSASGNSGSGSRTTSTTPGSRWQTWWWASSIWRR